MAVLACGDGQTYSGAGCVSAAITASGSSDTIRLYPQTGGYQEPVLTLTGSRILEAYDWSPGSRPTIEIDFSTSINHGILMNSGSPTVRGVKVVNATSSGIVPWIGATSPIVMDCDSSSNTQKGYWVGVSVTLVRCLSYNNGNEGFTRGGGNPSFHDCIAYGNASEGFVGYNSVFYHCVAYNNGLTAGTYAFRCNGASGSMSNCIAYNNNTPYGIGTISGAVESYNCSYGHSTGNFSAALGTGSIEADPLLVAPGSANFRLGSGSPCANTGTVTPVLVDIENVAWGSPPSMGAYKASSTAPSGLQYWYDADLGLWVTGSTIEPWRIG